eukprot:6489703-Amphidinium_carterae.1
MNFSSFDVFFKSPFQSFTTSIAYYVITQSTPLLKVNNDIQNKKNNTPSHCHYVVLFAFDNDDDDDDKLFELLQPQFQKGSTDKGCGNVSYWYVTCESEVVSQQGEG